nr:MAG TPA: YopX protein [Caudoviricetes sp.]
MIKQPKVYIIHLGMIAEVTEINFLDKEVEVYNKQNAVFDDPSTGFDVYSFDEVEFIYSTGIKDKNGKEIEHGDILKTEFAGILPIKFHNVYGFYAVKDDDKYWFAEETEDEVNETLSKTEVIGNIYENKDLLEVR